MERTNERHLNLRYVLYANNGRDWKDRACLQTLTLVKFLQSNQLNTKVLYREEEGLRDDLEIWSSDLTDEGIELMQTGVRKWYASHDRGKAIVDVKILEKYLAKIRTVAVTTQTGESE